MSQSSNIDFDEIFGGNPPISIPSIPFIPIPSIPSIPIPSISIPSIPSILSNSSITNEEKNEDEEHLQDIVNKKRKLYNPFHHLINLVDEVQEKLTDGEYKEIVETINYFRIKRLKMKLWNISITLPMRNPDYDIPLESNEIMIFEYKCIGTITDIEDLTEDLKEGKPIRFSNGYTYEVFGKEIGDVINTLILNVSCDLIIKASSYDQD